MCCDNNTINDINHTIKTTPYTGTTASLKIAFTVVHLDIFWCFCFACGIIAILAILGNGIVIYVSHVTRSTGRLRYLDNVVYSLAVTDFLFGIIGVPIITGQYYMRKFSRLTYKNIHKTNVLSKSNYSTVKIFSPF